jgi:large subunit ribosomal protein L22
MPGPKTNERVGTRAVLRGYHMSASKARVVLDLIRGQDVTTAREILAGTTREAAGVIAKVLASAVANATNNDGMVAEELFVSAAYADEGMTMKRFTPRARGRAGRIRKRSCHITVIVSRLDDETLERLRSQRSAQAAASRARRVATSRRRGGVEAAPVATEEFVEDQVATDQVEVDQVEVDEVEVDEVALDEVDGETTVDEVEESGSAGDETAAEDAAEEGE